MKFEVNPSKLSVQFLIIILAILNLFSCLIKGQENAFHYFHTNLTNHLQNVNLCCESEVFKSNGSCNFYKEINSDSDEKVQKLKLQNELTKRLECEGGTFDNFVLKLVSPNNTSVIYASDQNDLSHVWFEEDGTANMATGNFVYSEKSYCIHNFIDTNEIHILTCTPAYYTKNLSYSKCCSGAKSVLLKNNGKFECQLPKKDGESFLSLWNLKAKEDAHFEFNVHNISSLSLSLHWNNSSCTEGFYLDGSEFKIQHNGSIVLGDRYSYLESLDRYCVERMFDTSRRKYSIAVGYCKSEVDALKVRTWTWYVVYDGASSFFLGVAVLIYTILRKNQTTHWWIQFSVLISAFLFHFQLSLAATSLITQFLFSFEMPTFNTVMRRIHDFFTFGFLMNIINMNAHMLRMCLKSQPQVKPTEFRYFVPLIASVVVCWCFAACLTLVETLLHLLTGPETGVGETFDTSIIVIQCIITLVLSIGTGLALFKRLKESSHISSTKNVPAYSLVFTFLRLFLVTGTIWSLLILDKLVKKNGHQRGWFWDLTHFLTHTSGVGISIIFVAKKQTLDNLRKKFARQ